ncbi:MAG: NUDIX hydrolase [Actinobacteria bacterium]|nr:NUDIX hydrolase [Cyanobacteriota bacterium]MCL6087894.1 NUDIX hydrolase [Actinomycetota bacterium]
MTENLTEKTLKSKKIFDGSVIKLFFDEVILPNHKIATREKVWHPGAVAVVPVTSDNEVILIKQFRYPVGEVLIEIPAGKLDKNEIPIECAKRELKEETGAFGGNFIHLTSFYTTPGFSSEFLHLYMAINFERKENNLDEDEFLQIIKIPLKDSFDWVFEGKIKDAKSIIGILMADKYLKDNHCSLSDKFKK